MDGQTVQYMSLHKPLAITVRKLCSEYARKIIDVTEGEQLAES